MSKKHKQKKEKQRRERLRREKEQARVERRRSRKPDRPGIRGVAATPNARARAESPAREPSRFLTERARRWVMWARKSRDLPDPPTLQEIVEGGELEGFRDDPHEAAQEYAYAALETGDLRVAHDLARAAIGKDEGCCDAWRIVAATEATGAIDRVGYLKKALIAEQDRLAPVMEEFSGRLSDAVEAMPYLRVRFELATVLWMNGRRKRACEHLEQLLVDDADDIIGARYLLLMASLYEGDTERAAQIQEAAGEARAELLVRWAAVLEAVLRGEDEKADELYGELRGEFQSEAASLSKPPSPNLPPIGFYRDDVMEYAALCLRMLHEAWHAHEVSLAWLAARTSA